MATDYTHAKYTITISNMMVPFDVKKRNMPLYDYCSFCIIDYENT